MCLRALGFVTCILTLTACSKATRLDAEGFNTSATSLFFYHCDGESWVSTEANEKVCVLQSKSDPNTYLIIQDQAEGLAEDYLAGLLWEVIDVHSDDTPAAFKKAAEQYVREHYGTKARVTRFTPHDSLPGFTFEVIPADQMEGWLQSGGTIMQSDKEERKVRIEVLD